MMRITYLIIPKIMLRYVSELDHLMTRNREAAARICVFHLKMASLRSTGAWTSKSSTLTTLATNISNSRRFSIKLPNLLLIVACVGITVPYLPMAKLELVRHTPFRVQYSMLKENWRHIKAITQIASLVTQKNQGATAAV